MDKFVTRAPSWKTKIYAGSDTRKEATKKSLSQPLSRILNNNNSRRRLSVRDEKLLQVLSAPPDQPLVVGEENAQPPSDLGELSDYISVPQPGQQPQESCRGVHFLDDLEEEPLKSLPTAVTTSPVPVRRLQWMKLPATSAGAPCSITTTPTKQHRALMERIQRDLNSPSATVRMRAIKAMKSPTKSAYTLFDVSHSEQSLISAEERCTPPPAPTIQELMRDIVVYVEIRTGEDNRSTGVKKVISALGARVNDKLLRDTTHVVFKDGLLSTYKKAKHLNIPVVSILWIEACKTQRKICNAIEFPISNVDRYENPELYDKLKRHKSMQPDSECNKRIRAKPGTPKDVTPKTTALPSAHGTLKKTSTLIGGTPTSTIKKTDISHFFKRLGSENKTPIAENTLVHGIATPSPTKGGNTFAESPATQLLNRMTSNCYTPVTNVLIKEKTAALAPSTLNEIYDEESTDGPIYSVGSPAPKPRDVKKSLNFVNADTAVPPTPTRVKTRRRSSVLKSNIDAAIISIDEMSLSQTPTVETTFGISPAVRRTTRRRSSVHVQSTMSVCCDFTSTTTTSLAKQNDLTTIAEKETANDGDDEVNKSSTATAVLSKRTARRRTTYTCKTIDISKESTPTVETKREQNVASRRRTLYTPRRMEESLAAATLDCDELPVDTDSTLTLVPSEPPLATEDQPIEPTTDNTIVSSTRLFHNESTLTFATTITPIPVKVVSSTHLDNDVTTPATSSLLGQCSAASIFNSKRQPGRRRTLFDVSMDIITQRLQNINQDSARRSVASAHTPINSASFMDMRRNSTDTETPTPMLPRSLTPPNEPSQIERRAKLVTTTDASNVGEMGDAAYSARKNDNREADVVTAAMSVIKKKRKLFMPNDSLLALTPPANVATHLKGSSTIPNTLHLTPDSKRRRKVPLPQPQSESKLTVSLSSSSSAASMSSTPAECSERPLRRSTMDFQTVQRTKTTLATAATGAKKKQPFLVYTNMHKEQIEVIREAIKALGGFQLEYSISEATTHVVSLEPRRTLNLLRALARGLWILDYNWILASVRNGQWLNEEHYELRDFSRAVEICRTERQAFGNMYKCELFSCLGLFYISSRCGPISKDNIKELIVLCGGRITDQRKRAKYILGDVNRALEEKIYITPFWILDSITQMQLQPLKKYGTAEICKATQPHVKKALEPVHNELVQNSQI